MQKAEAVALLGPRSLSMPAWIKAALAANDRLKLYLSVLQAAAAHADQPEREALDLAREIAAAGIAPPDAAWLHDLPGGAARTAGGLLVPDLPRLAGGLAADLRTMARPLLSGDLPHDAAGDAPGTLQADPLQADLQARLQHWTGWLATLRDEHLSRDALRQLTHGSRQAGDSLHILVMDLHRQLNRLAAALAGDTVDGAHVWQLDDRPGDPDGTLDRDRVRAFMRGLNRTAPLKFDHPGLDTAATRDGARLLLQNDIGTNDAHVLVVQVEGRCITLTYSDLHHSRFGFFQDLLGDLGATWSVVEPRVSEGLNRGEAYWVGTARVEAGDEDTLQRALEGLGARIVFLIDWNRARKRLLAFVDKDAAVRVLTEAARREAGHMAWLKAGGERLIYDAMQALGEGAFRIGDRLDEVLGTPAACDFLVTVLQGAATALLADRPVALVADEVRLLLGRTVRQRGNQFDLLAEHAAYCHALAQALRDALAHGHARDPARAADLSARAKVWERRADHLVMQARDHAVRQPRWRPVAALLQTSDDVADALEEATFLVSLIADDHHQGWNAEVQRVLDELADAVLDATQEHVKAVAVARGLGLTADDTDGDDFLAASWNVLRGERRCDELLRAARRVLLAHLRDAATLRVADDLAQCLERASDHLLTAGYALRALAFDRVDERVEDHPVDGRTDEAADRRP